MNPTHIASSALVTSANNLSFFDLFMQADILVKLVIIGLFLVSIWSWAIVIEKFLLLRRVRGMTDRFEKQFWSGTSLEDLYKALSNGNNKAMAALFVSAMREWKRSHGIDSQSHSGLQMRVDKVMDVTIAREMERLEGRLSFLATIGSTAPFVGLFGTVWGIMVSFQAISVSGNTSLAIVAPGIAEALFATLLGLMAAIPAVVFYNFFSNEITRYAVRLERFADEFSAILSRHIDERT